MCHVASVRNTFFLRWSAILGMLAMLGAVLAVPAGAMAAMTTALPAMSGSHDGMPCKKPCPECPKPCSDMGACMVKCFKSVAPVLELTRAAPLEVYVPRQAAHPRDFGTTSVPPLLRPPIA